MAQSPLKNKYIMGIDPATADERIIEVIGDGKDGAIIQILSSGNPMVTEHDIVVTPGGQKLVVHEIQQVEDFFESYTVYLVSIITNDPTTAVLDPLLREQKILGRESQGIWAQIQRNNVHVYDPTKTITLESFKEIINSIENEKPEEKTHRIVQGKKGNGSFRSAASRVRDYFTRARRK